ncbi:hypothetical protein [Macrococcus armenti]|nr:hypothetical protein [Macrococcus armenti]UBH12632.1 hypothetical protein LAU43_08660 [Macrococcus armenti]
MTFNKKGEHRAFRSGGTKLRSNGEKFCNTFQGKLAEFSFKILLNEYNIRSSGIDMSIKKLGEWDDYDIKVNDKVISIKSIKHFSEFLLLEKKDYFENGDYKHTDTQWDYIVTIKIKNDLADYMKDNNMDKKDFISKNDLKELVDNITFTYDFAGYIDRNDFINIVKNKQIIYKNDTIGSERNFIDADNYYERTINLKNINHLIKELEF